MNAAALILVLLGAVVVLAWLAGRAVRVPAPACSQDCNQGRGCTCAETQP
jgi:hypothetical protein